MKTFGKGVKTMATVYYTVQYQGAIEFPKGVDPEEYLNDLTNQELLSHSETKMAITVDSVEEA